MIRCRRPRGYIPPPNVRAALKSCFETNVLLSALTALSDHAGIVLCAAGFYLAWQLLPLAAAIAVYCILLPAITRCLRGLENMTHEGAHFNWCRKCRWINDLLTNLLAAIPTFSTVQAYRPAHMQHHDSFASADDPCYKRYRILGIEKMDRKRPAEFLAGLLRRLVPYSVGWWQAVRTQPSVAALALAWHLTFYMALPALAIGWQAAALLWLVCFAIPFGVTLPAARFLAESARHRYAETETEFDGTVNNLGWVHQFFLHPHGDGFHLLHHIYRCIPHHKLRRAHQILTALDPQGYGGKGKRRRRIFEDPGCGS